MTSAPKEKSKKNSAQQIPLSWVIVLFFFQLFITQGPNWIGTIHDIRSTRPSVKSNMDAQPQPIEEYTPEADNSCPELMPLDILAIDINLENIDFEKKTNLFTPNGKGNTLEGSFWLSKLIKPNFKSIFLEFEVAQLENDVSGNPPTMIWTLVLPNEDITNRTVTKLWLPEYSIKESEEPLQLARFGKRSENDSTEKLEDESIALNDPVRLGQLDTLFIESEDINGNELTLKFTYTYTSARTGKPVNPFTFTKQISLSPISNVEGSNELLDIGIGTYVGNSLRVSSLKICE